MNCFLKNQNSIKRTTLLAPVVWDSQHWASFMSPLDQIVPVNSS